MPTLSLSVGSSLHDGHSFLDQRQNAWATTFDTSLLANLGCHLSEASVVGRFFIFRFGNGNPSSGIPQGAIINEAKLDLRFNNGAAAGGVHDHAYICVENNLDPTGTGAILNGTLGRQPWQRLGRQSAATTLFGARCGPTHTGDLATVGRGVRDSQAYVYKAFGDARQITGGAWQKTDNFSGALQALVNDPGWNDSSQYVMVHLFSDHRISAGSTGGIGYLGGISWASGQTGTVGEGNSSGTQIYFQDHSSGLYSPKLEVDYTLTSLKSVFGKSESIGSVRLQRSICLGRIRGERKEDVGAGSPMLPVQATGSHDLPFTGMSTVNPNDIGWQNGNPIGPRTKWSGQRPGRVDGYSIAQEDYASGRAAIWWDINRYQDVYPTRDVYSLRFYARADGVGWANALHNIVKFELNGVEAFSISHRGQHSEVWPIIRDGEIAINWPGKAGSPDYGSYQFTPAGGGGFWRYEIQVSNITTPKVRLRMYLDDQTTPIETFEFNPPSTEMNRVVLGETDPNTYLGRRLSDIEIWSDYTLNREYPLEISNTVGTPYKPPEWTWFEYNGGTSYTSLEDLGTIDSIEPDGSDVVMTTPNNKLTLEDTRAEAWNGGSLSYTKYTNLSYGTGSKRSLDLYVPTGTPPDGGWPTIVYTHGGFWLSGSKELISEALVVDATLRGYAVASCNYSLSAIAINNPYPAWNPNENTGRYPTFILNYKEAAYWLQNTGAGLYNLNPDKFIATGHSAGGYNALGAAVTTNLTNDGAGRNLTLAGNTATFDCPNVPDPVFIGAYSLAGPVNIDKLRAWDPTHPDWPYLGLSIGVIHATCRTFMGRRLDNGSTNTDFVNLDEFVILNAANIPPVGYAWGTADHLVVSARFTPYSQELALRTAFETAAGSLPAGTTYEGHEVPDALHHTIQDVDFDFEHFFRWLKKLPGLQ